MISTFKELIASGEEIKFEDISPDLMTLTIKIRGEQFDSSITGEVAKAIGAFQSALYRALRSLLKYPPVARNIRFLVKNFFRPY